MSWWLVSPAPWSSGSYLLNHPPLYPLNPNLLPLYPPLELETSSLDDEPREGDPAEVPESSTLALMAIGLAALYFGLASRRRAPRRF
jgi:hypothetical protein